ncbi:hypothetical protein UNPF46_24375 [Bradyrhizobium sp. UNPF46]|nr:hypothetical protein UNPF46_24375 [Bradyrhizobium sp. UNPF46]
MASPILSSSLLYQSKYRGVAGFSGKVRWMVSRGTFMMYASMHVTGDVLTTKAFSKILAQFTVTAHTFA